MFILANRNIELPTPDWSERYTVRRGFLGDVPDRFCQTSYFDALVRDGKIVLPASHEDKSVDAAAESGEKVLEETVKRGRKPKD